MKIGYKIRSRGVILRRVIVETSFVIDYSSKWPQHETFLSSAKSPTNPHQKNNGNVDNV